MADETQPTPAAPAAAPAPVPAAQLSADAAKEAAALVAKQAVAALLDPEDS